MSVYHFTGCPQSYFPLTTLTLTPGKSLVLPPSTNTTLCSCRVCPSPGMKAIISFPLLRRTRQHLRLAEFGFLGFLMRSCSTIPFICGLPLMGPRALGFRLMGPCLMIWFSVLHHAGEACSSLTLVRLTSTTARHPLHRLQLAGLLARRRYEYLRVDASLIQTPMS